MTDPAEEGAVDKQDIQLQRAVDLLKGWNIFKGIMPSQTQANTKAAH